MKRSGEVILVNGTHVGVWEDEVDEDGLLLVIRGVLGHLSKRGWKVERDPDTQRNYPEIAHCFFCGRKGDLELRVRVSGCHAEIELYQNVANVTNPHGGQYEFDKFAKMPRRLRLPCVVELAAIVRELTERGYALGKGFDLTTEGAPFLLRVLRACEGESAGTRRADEPLRTFNDGWTAERFERDETGWPVVSEYDHDGRNCDRDKVSLRNGQTRYFRDGRGRLQRGTVYTNMNSMWMVVFGGSVTYMSGCYLFSCERPDLEPRRVMPGQKKRLRDELAKAVAASNLRRVEVLARVLRGFSDAKARKAA